MHNYYALALATCFEVAQFSTDYYSIIISPVRVSDGTPFSRHVDLHSTFPLVGTSYQTNISITIILTICNRGSNIMRKK